jgi:hypothetical protein
VFKQKAIEEALTLLKENGFEVPEPVARNSKSRTSSEMLFGENGSSKKREAKAGDKDETQSIRSGISKRSMKKEDVIINEAWWTKLDEKNHWRNYFY